ncbi:hypothetical protein ANCDUO_22518 [Ancylostoma duodenale]|uniref:Uncharacterized protein n=1 Tax=Ancylostoma duodenale TaxID=51022 RepID=A0A0C2BU30_9BILA|nr:hypothetical protein ANCDUO_22518 [Ancylostoma duodenale]
MLFVFLKRTESIGRLWHTRGTNGRIAGARSIHPKTNGSQGYLHSRVLRGLLKGQNAVAPKGCLAAMFLYMCASVTHIFSGMSFHMEPQPSKEYQKNAATMEDPTLSHGMRNIFSCQIKHAPDQRSSLELITPPNSNSY